MMVFLNNVTRSVWTLAWCVVIVTLAVMVVEVMTLNGANVCMVKQKYNITKRVKYRAPMSVRTYEWCFSMPPRCSKWNTEMRDLTRLETEERTAEVAVCCPGYRMKDVSCVPICPNGKTGSKCTEDCRPDEWGPNCVYDCGPCEHGTCSPSTGDCICRDGWQGESCGASMLTPAASKTVEEVLTIKPTTKMSTPPTTTTTTATIPKHAYVEFKTTSIAPTTEIPTSSTSLKTTSVFTSTKVSASSPTSTIVTIEKETESTSSTTIENLEPISIESIMSYNNVTLTILATANAINEETTQRTLITTIYNGPETSVAAKPTEVITVPQVTTEAAENVTEMEILTSKATISQWTTKSLKNISEAIVAPTNTAKPAHKTTEATVPITFSPKLGTEAAMSTTEISKTTVESTTRETSPTITLITKENMKLETTNKPEIAVKVLSTTAKFQPKEIWIKPAQKGEITNEQKKINDVSRHKSATYKEFTTNTTPKTIIVSIIPTSVSYATFKKIALTTASFLAQKRNTTIQSFSKRTEEFTRPMLVQLLTSTPVTTKLITKNLNSGTQMVKNITKPTFNTTPVVTKNYMKAESTRNKTNSTTEITTPANTKLNSFNFSNVLSTNSKNFTQNQNVSTTTTKNHTSTQSYKKTEYMFTNKHFIVSKPKNVTKSVSRNITDTTERNKARKDLPKTNITKSLTNTNKITTEDPTDEETFHILTEPEHITAVMGDKETGRSSVDLISVISIAGGVMMTVITVAVIIVMLERCKRPRYEDVRKINDIRMQVMIDNNDAPPPYARSIFHTPLPEPPTSDKCHYQPISTLDRNLKQFMRPVVVQTISPIMLENFRGILECHYDHLPRRSHDFATIQTRHSIAPSMSSGHELRQLRARSVTESTIDALKCEAKLDVIDNTTSEPLYAEIPCWRPPSEHAIEIMNMNGEAVTEL